MDRYFFVLTTIDLFVLGFMCLLTKLSESLNKKQKRGFFLAFALIAAISVLEVITIVVAGTPPGRGADPCGARLAPTEWPLGRARLR